MPDPRVLGIVLAGGAGTRLSPLTADRAKPAVPFGGLYRLIDFALSNMANASIRKICVLTQYKSHSLDRHISTTWRMSSLLGNYVFDTDVLVDALRKDADDDSSRHDIGGNIIPMLVADGAAQAYDFMTNVVPGATDRDCGYWRDVGTIDAYFDAHMDLRTVEPMFNLYNYRWPILTHVEALPPAKFVHEEGDRIGRAIDSLVSNGVIVSGGLVRQSVLSPGVRVNSWATVDRCILLHNTVVGRHAEIRDAIIDKNVVVPEGVRIGVDKEHDLARGFVVSPGGITVVGKAQVVTE